MSSECVSTLRAAEAEFRPSLISPAHTCRDHVPTFPTPFATTVFNQCSGGWFEASLRRAAPKGHTTFIYSYSTTEGDTVITQLPQPPVFMFTSNKHTLVAITSTFACRTRPIVIGWLRRISQRGQPPHDKGDRHTTRTG